MTNKLFVVALPFEARPLIEFFALKKVEIAPRFNFYQGKETNLIVSGVGSLSSAIATTWALSRLGRDTLSALHCFNFGLCGSSSLELSVGELCGITRLLDVEQGREFFPGIVEGSALPEKSLATHAKPVGRKQEAKAELVDMEASGFFQAASRFLEKDRIHIVKMVSDHLEPKKLDKNLLATKLKKAVPALADYFEKIQ